MHFKTHVAGTIYVLYVPEALGGSEEQVRRGHSVDSKSHNAPYFRDRTALIFLAFAKVLLRGRTPNVFEYE